MNYIELIRQFWICNSERPLGCNATALYFYLLKVCNSLGWKDTFKHSDRYIAINLGISVNTVRSSKNKLKQVGLIDFSSPSKPSRGLDGSTSYSILTVSNFNTDAGMVTDTLVDTDTPTVLDTRNKPNKTKPNKEVGSKAPKKKAPAFKPPTLDQVSVYCAERGNAVNPSRFIDFYASKGWMVGKNKMKDWKACVRTWEQRDATSAKNTHAIVSHQNTQVYEQF